MTTETITMTKITASEGMVLTNNEIYGKTIFLGSGDKTENYHEISETEYQEIVDKKEKSEEML